MENTAGLMSWRGAPGVEALSRKWGWTLALGLALTFLGLFAAVYVMASTLVSVFVLGYCVLFGGILHTVGAFWVKEWSGFFVELLIGIFGAVVGMMLLSHPMAAGAGITLLLAVFFMVEGAFRFLGALIHRYTGWGFGAFSGAVSFALGLMVYREWPSSALWLLGTFLAVRLLFAGAGLIGLSMTLRQLGRAKR